MNTIDIHEGLVANLEWEAKKQAELDAIYESERRKYSSYYSASEPDYDDYNDERMSSLEERLDTIESKIDKLYDLVVERSESNGLFVFAPEKNVNANLAFTLTDDQFKELIRSINK